MKREHLKALKDNELLRKRLAKYMALNCFRNTELENLHAGMGPSSKAGDNSDVKVISPYGEIPWNELSRLNDAEMKTLMIDVVNHCHLFLSMLFATRGGEELIESLKEQDPVPQWNDPESPGEWMSARLSRGGSGHPD